MFPASVRPTGRWDANVLYGEQTMRLAPSNSGRYIAPARAPFAAYMLSSQRRNTNSPSIAFASDRAQSALSHSSTLALSFSGLWATRSGTADAQFLLLSTAKPRSPPARRLSGLQCPRNIQISNFPRALPERAWLTGRHALTLSPVERLGADT